MRFIIKRNGDSAPFQSDKIAIAITKANNEMISEIDKIDDVGIAYIIHTIDAELDARINRNQDLTVEEIQDMVEDGLMRHGKYKLARAYIRYRHNRELVRRANTTDDSVLSLIDLENKEVMEENSNKAAHIASTQRDLIAGEVSKDLTWRKLLPKEIADAHRDGILHFHDADYYAQHIHNCCLVNLEDMLQNGTVINGTMIETPKSFSTACTVATQIMAVIASGQYGGQTISLSHLAPFVDVSRKKIRKKVEREVALTIKHTNANGLTNVFNSIVDEITEQRVRDEVASGVQTIQYQINTINSSNGQTPFVSIFAYLNEVDDERTKDDLAMIIEEVLIQRYKGTKNESGVYISPTFPKILYMLQEDNINPDGKYYYLTELAAKCTAKRMVPDYISEKVMKTIKVDKDGVGYAYGCMGCRSFLAPYNDENGKPKFYGRFNQGVVTLNLVDVGLSANGDIDKFWELMEERTELCHRALRCRHERLLGTPSDISPIHWQHGGLSRLEKGEPIDKLLFGSYSSISLGYAGLCECCVAMTGKSHTDPSVTDFALDIMKFMNAKCEKWKDEENIGYAVYGSPIESTTYHFARKLKERFGIIKDVTDHDYITNSYHYSVRENVDAFTKLTFESQFQNLSSGGAISYVEVPNLEDNLDAVLAVIRHIYDHIMYAELNTKSDYCQVCGWDREIEIKEEDDGHLYWCCPNCGNRDQRKMNVTRRTCGYLGSQFWNQGRTQEIRERVLHL